MNIFLCELKLNLRHRFSDGFVIGYNVIFPAIMIGLLGLLCREFSHGGITSFQYYTVVTIPFCILMAIITSAYACKDDAYAKTAERVLLTPLSVGSIVAAKVISTTFVIFICSILTYIGAALLTGISLKTFGVICILFLLLSFVTSALGTLIGLGVSNFLLIKNIMNIPICLFGIMGGVFFPIGTLHPAENFLLNLSIFRWVNRGLFALLFDNQSMLCIVLCVSLLIIGIILCMISVIIFKKEEYCNGCIPGYEK